jgi:hypothetical protein
MHDRLASSVAAAARLLRYRKYFAARFGHDARMWWLLPALAFAATAAVAFSFYKDALFYRYDGTFVLTMALGQKEWMAGGIGFSLNFLQGLGDIWLPLATGLFPGFALGTHLANPRWLPVIACFVFALEYFFSTLVLGRCIGASRLLSLSAAVIGAMFTMPFFVPTLAAWRFWGNPDFMTFLAVNSLTLSAYLAIGRTNWRIDIALAASILGLLIYTILIAPFGIVTFAPMLAFFGAAALFGAESSAERLRKPLAATLIAVIMGVSFGAYIFALFYYARTTYFWNDIASFAIDWKQQSFVLSESGRAGPYLWVACLAGAALAAWREHGRLRLFAIAFLLFVLLQQAIYLTMAIAGRSWGGPPLAYVDMYCLPLYALFGAYLLIGWGSSSADHGRWAMPAIALLPCVSLLTLHHPFSNLRFHQENPFPWPPHETSITRLLQAEIGLHEGGAFRGRVANIAGTEFEPQYAWAPVISQHDYDGAVAFQTGNDHRYYGMWYFGIPTLIESNQFTSPFFHVINSRLLDTPEQKHARNLTTITRFRTRIFAMLGVRFVITSRPLPGLAPKQTLVVQPEYPEQWTLFLYELPDAKVAGYWSLHPRPVGDTHQAMLWMDAPAGSDDSAVYETITAPLVAGDSSQIRVFRDRLEVEAQSPGTSLLVLPVEFSHCFDIRLSRSGAARFLRANVDQAAFLFSGQLHAELRYRYSPWHFGCRLRDIADADRLKLTETGWPH